jgi:hypothetical protein
MVANAGWGKLGNQDPYNSSIASDYSKGLYEVGIQLDNLLKSSTGGLGIGTYYRLGTYQATNAKENWMIKLTSSMLF